MAKVEATEFVRHRYWCPHCLAIKVAPCAPEEIPHSYPGANILIQTVIMKYHQGLSFEKVRQFFKDFCNLTVTDSALSQALIGWHHLPKNLIPEIDFNET